MASSLEIKCSACGRLTLARAEPVYEDFKKVAEAYVCTACGHRYPSREKTPFVDANGRPRVFSEADKPAAVKVFKSDERRRSCAWCRHFIVNPFYQRCGLNNRPVEATDVCARFLAKPDQPAAAGSGAGGTGSVSSRFDALFQKDEPETPAVRAPAEVVAPAAPREAPVRKPAVAVAPAAPAPDEPPARKKAAKKPAAKPRKANK